MGLIATLEGFKNKLYLVVGLLLFGSLFFSYYTMKIWGIAREIAERIKAEASLKSERDMMHRIMETSPAGITRVDANGLVVYANERAEKILGIQRSDISSHAYNDPKWKITDIDGKPLPDEKMPFNIVKQTHKPVFDVQHCIESSDGNRLLLSINAMPLLNDSGIFDGMVAAIEDITEKFLAEQNYKMLFNKMIDGFALHEIICDKQGRPIDYRFLVVNPSFERLTGLKSEYLIGNTVLEVMPETESYWIDAYGQVALTGNPKHFENYSKELNRHFQVTAFRPAMKQFACIIVDISERKQAEKEIWESTERFQKVFNSHLDAIFVLNTEVPALIIETNNSALKIFGYTTNEVIGKSEEILHADEFHLKAFQEKLFSVIELEGSLTGFEFKMKRKDGTVFPTEHSVFELKNDFGKRTGWISIVCDLTNRKITEDRLRQAQKMESIGSLAGGIAHDLNNILFPITGLSEMLLDDIPPDTAEHDSIAQIYKSAQRGSDLVKQILAFSRQSSPRKLPIHIQPILKEVLKLARATIPMNIEITSHINTDCGMVSADPTQMHQIMMNLITNACHAVEGSGGTIHIALKETAIGSFGEKEELSFHAIPGDLLAGRYACISVTDTGTGIDQALIHKIFDPYFTTKELGKGTGLGLSMVYGIAKEHGGEVRVYSELGKGTVFHVYLPLLEDAKDGKDAAVARKYPTGCERILLVDDEASVVLLEQMMLERLGYRATAHTSSPDALAAFKANPGNFDLVISDRGMPNMTGEQLAVELISIRPGIPIILCTGFSDEADVQRASAMGIKGFLMKPVATGDLAEMVRKVLDEDAGSKCV